jgi:hypothetical protein
MRLAEIPRWWPQHASRDQFPHLVNSIARPFRCQLEPAQQRGTLDTHVVPPAYDKVCAVIY